MHDEIQNFLNDIKQRGIYAAIFAGVALDINVAFTKLSKIVACKPQLFNIESILPIIKSGQEAVVCDENFYYKAKINEIILNKDKGWLLRLTNDTLYRLENFEKAYKYLVTNPQYTEPLKGLIKLLEEYDPSKNKLVAVTGKTVTSFEDIDCNVSYKLVNISKYEPHDLQSILNFIGNKNMFHILGYNGQHEIVALTKIEGDVNVVFSPVGSASYVHVPLSETPTQVKFANTGFPLGVKVD